MFTARRIAQILFLILFILLFLMAIYPTASSLPVDFILRLDPLIIVSSTISARAIIAKSIPTLILLIVTLLLGRFFCGWICPLGTTIDGCDNAVKSKYQNERFLKFRWLKFGVLVIILIAAILSVQLAGFVSPLPLLTRTFTTFLYPLFELTPAWSALFSQKRHGCGQSPCSAAKSHVIHSAANHQNQSHL